MVTRHNRRRAGCGFTLLELLIVLAILSALLTLVVPRYFQHERHAKEVVLADNLNTVRAVIGHFFGDTGRYPDSLQELVDRQYLRALPRDPLTESTDTWQVVAPPDGYPGQVYDLRSGAPGQDPGGRAYADY